MYAKKASAQFPEHRLNRLTLVGTNLRRKPTRTLLTMLSLVIAFFLFMLLRAIAAAFAGEVSPRGVQRVYVDAKYSMTDNLPLADVGAIGGVPGVASVTPMVWFGGYYREPKNAFAKIPVDHTRFFSVYPDLIVSTETLARFNDSRRAVVVADSLARRFGWKVGDVIPIRGDIWPKEDGSWDWEFVLAGTYSAPSGSRVQELFLIRYDYFTESVADWVKNQVGWIVARLDDGVKPPAVIDGIDALFENSSDPTKTLSEDDYSRQFASQLGDIVAITTVILLAVFFTILLLTANVAWLAFRERVPELAVLKTLGFSDGEVSYLVLLEAFALCLAGAAGGIALGYGLGPVLNANLAQVLGRIDMRWVDAAEAGAIAAVMGLIIGLPPAIAARRLPIVRALTET